MFRSPWMGLAIVACPVLAAMAASTPAPVVLTAAATSPLTLSDAIARALQDNPGMTSAEAGRYETESVWKDTLVHAHINAKTGEITRAGHPGDGCN